MKYSILALSAMTSWSAYATLPNPNDVYFQGVSYAGTGCPTGSAAAQLSPDRQELTISFDNFVAEAGGGKIQDRKACTVTTGIHIPQGFSVSIIGVDFRGANFLPQGASSQFDVQYYFAGYPRGVRPASVRYSGPLDDNFQIHNDLIATALVWSRCGDSVNLNMLPSIKVNSPWGEQANMSIDTIDQSISMIYRLSWKRC